MAFPLIRPPKDGQSVPKEGSRNPSSRISANCSELGQFETHSIRLQLCSVHTTQGPVGVLSGSKGLLGVLLGSHLSSLEVHLESLQTSRHPVEDLARVVLGVRKGSVLFHFYLI